MNERFDPLLQTRGEELPPVKPPTGTFLLQLFLIPAVIVTAIFLVVGLFGMLADSGSDPQQYVRDLLHSDGGRRWRSAHMLAKMLTADRQSPFQLNRRLTSDRRLAASLADTLRRILDRETDVGDTNSEEDTGLRAYLATALGMFDDPVGVPVLLQATRDDQTEVRLRALESLALLADRTGVLRDPNLVEELAAVADDDNSEPVVRKMCAYVMGVVAVACPVCQRSDRSAVDRAIEAGDPVRTITQRFEIPASDLRVHNRLARFVGDPPDRPGPLVRLVADPNADVSYNAATALARLGRADGLRVLNRMLTADPSRLDIIQEEQTGFQAFKTSTVLLGALEAIKVLVRKNSEVDLRPLLPNIEKLTKKTNPDLTRVRVVAAEVQRLIRQRIKGQ